MLKTSSPEDSQNSVVIIIINIILCVHTHTSPMAWGSIPGWVIQKTKKKWYLIPLCLTLSIIRYLSGVKWSNPRKGVAPSATPWCSNYWKGSPSTTVSQLMYIYIFLLSAFFFFFFFFFSIKKKSFQFDLNNCTDLSFYEILILIQIFFRTSGWEYR